MQAGLGSPTMDATIAATHGDSEAMEGVETQETAKGDKKHVTKLLTLSPEALRVAAEITPHRLANLLIRKGPLAIRLITAELAVEVPGFDHLSLSKQRRLIMAAMEQSDPVNNVVFEKIGWGQWAVRKVDLDYIVTDAAGDGSNPKARVNIKELKERAKLGWLKKNADGLDLRRGSISNSKPNLHNIAVPNEPSRTGAIMSESDSDMDDDNLVEVLGHRDHVDDHEVDDAVDDDDDDDEDDDDEDALELDSEDVNVLHFRMSVPAAAATEDNAIALDDDEDELFEFDADDAPPVATITKLKRSPPLKFANRVPTKFSPPPALSSNSRRKSSSAGASSLVSKSTRHQIFTRSRLNSLENLDSYIVSSARSSSLSVSSPPPHPPPSAPANSGLASGLVSLPLGSWTSKAGLSPETLSPALLHTGRRKSSFNESNLRSTLSLSLPRYRASDDRAPVLNDAIVSDTDEEDWASIGPETLRKHLAGLSSPAKEGDENTAARALVDLMTV